MSAVALFAVSVSNVTSAKLQAKGVLIDSEKIQLINIVSSMGLRLEGDNKKNFEKLVAKVLDEGTGSVTLHSSHESKTKN